ncbi:LysR family transcriptional regulator [Bifidobacterium avesanii]|uniref:LysR family transcriptional regulator n=1 Tax=Bifidobacterium avesanii TaxID=1798157 RepID=A0A7K3TFJ0_9BIFI|nr:LysR family transcriptional regulator [Bifidobacterium avesanii]KAB8291513.1 LysR family transcriptional regulator [Bifidobacterium avesanii]NEG77858.1 LysR family transcriptional regulator [Bifidobacterium avesanii]
MYDRRLDAVVAAARTGSFAKAARLLHVSAPALAKQVNTFEAEFGITLFTRSRSGVALTPAGREFVEDARPVMRQCDDILRRARRRSAAANDFRDVPVRLGVSMLRSGRRILDLWQRDAEPRSDGLRLELVPMPDDERDITDIIAHLGEDVDAVSTAFNAGYWDHVCGTLTLSREPLCVAVPYDHALARRESVSLDDLEGTRIRIMRRGHDGNDRARDLLEAHPSIELVDIDRYNLAVFNDCAQTGDLLISKPLWDGVHPQLVNVPVDWGEPVDLAYGLLYPLDPEPQVAAFVERIGQLARTAPVIPAERPISRR